MLIQGGPKRMETFISCAIKNRSWDLHNIKDRCASVHGNLFDIRLNIASSVLLHLGDNTGRYLFSPVHSFVKN